MLRAFLAFLVSILLSSVAFAKKAPEPVPASDLPNAVGPRDGSLTPEPRFALAAANTTILASYSFDSGGTCSAQGWTVVDGTAQTAIFWHVDDFTGVNVNPGDALAPLAGSKSLWCGARAAASGSVCGYMNLPGYGNDWHQAWQTKSCITLTGDLDVSFLMKIDSEAGYDAVFLEYTTDCASPAPISDWNVIEGGIGEWDGLQTISHVGSYAVPGPLQLRLRFASDGAYSDEDGAFDSHAGPVVIDNLAAEGLALEDFEGEDVNATTSNDWEAYLLPGYGAQYMALFPGSAQLQRFGGCVKDLSCLWAATLGSPETYSCGGYPLQAAVPKGNSEGQYINAEIGSPLIPIVGSGSRIDFGFSVYRDFSLDGLVFNIWDVRAVVDGCEGPWRSRGFVYFDGQGGWLDARFPVGDLIPANASHFRVRLGVIDQCAVWCGVFGTGACHSNAPLFDNAKVYRVDIVGPTYSTRDIDMFQDTFPTDGTDTGIGRADAARSITASASSTIYPADSVTFTCMDPITAVIPSNRSGLADDLALGGKQMYIWVHVIDSGVPSLTKTAAALTDDAVRYPFKDTQVANGKSWTRIRCDLAIVTNSTFRIDLNDNLFQAGDVIEFFFGSTNTNGQTSYCSGSALTYVQSDADIAAEAASEFTILPLNGNGTNGNDLLFVDGMDGRGAQVYWDTAFDQMNLAPDRYDVRGPTSSVSNRPGTRVTDVNQQLNANYQGIFWECGDLTQGLGDGTGSPEKSNDYAMVNTFLAGLSSQGGIYICGDDQPSGLIAAAGGSAVTFKSTYITYTLTTGDAKPAYGVAPIGTGTPGNIFAGNTWIIHGGCPLINDFDVMTATGSSVMQASYGAPAGNNAAVVSKVTGNAKVVFAGFGLTYIRDDDENGIMDRAEYLYDLLVFITSSPDQPTGTAPIAVDRLEQNYPNPFNPQTTIAFSIQERSRVRIDVYNVTGERVSTLLDETRAAGSYTDVRWDGTNDVNQPVASGVYLYRLVAGGFTQTRKMVLLK